MFHVLTEKTVPADRLIAGTYNHATGEFSNTPNDVMCGAGVGQRREAISHKNFTKYANEGKLRLKNMCKACGKKLGFRISKENEDNV